MSGQLFAAGAPTDLRRDDDRRMVATSARRANRIAAVATDVCHLSLG
jgi:hypothetical protein